MNRVVVSESRLMSYDVTSVKTASIVTAPDGSIIRELTVLPGASFVHCTLPPQTTARAIQHRTVSECWFILHGQGELWRRQGATERIISLEPGVCLTILPNTAFQFRNTSQLPLEIFIATLPPWSGAAEARFVSGHWPAHFLENQHPSS